MTARTARTLGVVVLLASSQPWLGARQAYQARVVSAEKIAEKAVYEAAIEDVLKNAEPGHAAQIGIRSMTTLGPRGGDATQLEETLKDVGDATMRKHFIAVNRTPSAFDAAPTLSVPHVVRPWDLTPPDFWTQFYRSFPGSAGIVGLSRVGFDDTLTHALVYREHLHGNRAMSGVYLLLVRGPQGWTIEKTIPAWIA